MDFWGAIYLLRRRWYAVLAALAVSAGIALLTFASIPTIYESTSVAVLTSPANGAHFSPSVRPEDVEKINPLLAFDGSLETTAQIVRQVLRDPATKKELGAGSDGQEGVDYEVTNGDATTSGPFLFIVVTSESPVTSQNMTAAVMQRSIQELKNRQQAVGAPPQTYITAEVLVQPTVPEAKINGKLRYAGASLVLTLIFTFAAVFALDNALTTRRTRGILGSPAVRLESGSRGGIRQVAPQADTGHPPVPASAVTSVVPDQSHSVQAVPSRTTGPVEDVPGRSAPLETEPVGGPRAPLNGRPVDARRRRPSPRLLDPPS